MKILEVTNLFAPVHGGAAEAPFQLSKHLAKRGHEVTVYTSDFRISREYITSIPDVKVYSFKTRLNLASLQFTPGIRKTAISEIKSFDIIHLHNFRTYQNIVIHSRARGCSVPYVLQAHGSLPRIVSKKGLKVVFDKLWGQKMLGGAKKVIAVSRMEADQYRNSGVSDDKISMIDHGIDLSEFANLPEKGLFRKRFNLDAGTKIILYLGRIHKIKGLDLLTRAFEGLATECNDTRLIIAGPDDGYLIELKKIIRGLGLEDKVILPGFLYGRAKLEAFIDSDVYVLPSFYEIFGITILEAWACGKPVIVTTGCGLADVISGQAGLVVSNDKDQLRDALHKVLKDDELRKKFGAKGELLVRERFNWELVSEQVENLYRGVLERE